MDNRPRTPSPIARLLASVTLAAASLAATAAPPVDALLLKYSVGDRAGNPMGSLKIDVPYFQGRDTEVFEQINLHLHHLQLNTLPPSPTAAEAAARKTVALPVTPALVGVSQMEFLPARKLNEGRVLAVGVAMEGCGAYCEAFYRDYAFDLRTGRRLVLPELVTPQGTAALSQLAAVAHEQALKKALAQVSRELRRGSKSRTPEQQELLEIQRAIYSDCLERQRLDNVPSIDDAVFEDHALVFSAGRCSNHASQADDDLGDLQFRADAQTLRPHLTPYGLAVLLNEGDAPPPVLNPYAQVFKGAIDDRWLVTLVFDLGESAEARAQPFAAATYYYDRHRRPIPLTVRVESDGWTLTEQPATDADEEAAGQPSPPPAVIRVRRQDRKLVGEWRLGDKRFAFSAGAFPLLH